MHCLGQCPIEVTDEENDDSKLQGAFEDMRRLDEILSAKICTEKEVRRRRKDLQAKLWHEFLVDKLVAFTTLTLPVHHTSTVVAEKVVTLITYGVMSYCVFFCSRIHLKVTLNVPKKQ